MEFFENVVGRTLVVHGMLRLLSDVELEAEAAAGVTHDRMH